MRITFALLLLALVALSCATKAPQRKEPPSPWDSYSSARMTKQEALTFIMSPPTNGLTFSMLAVESYGPFFLPSEISGGLNICHAPSNVCVIAWIRETNSFWLQTSTNLTSTNWTNEILLTNGVTCWIDRKMRGPNRVYRLSSGP